jgi:hypothetical protein
MARVALVPPDRRPQEEDLRSLRHASAQGGLMAIDRFVRWKPRTKDSPAKPSRNDIRNVLEDYLGDVLLRIDVDGPRITALLKGKPSFPFKRIPEMGKYTEGQEQHDERWLEVYWTNTNIDVITRMTDEFTNVVAEGFAALAARFWEGKRDPSS